MKRYDINKCFLHLQLPLSFTWKNANFENRTGYHYIDDKICLKHVWSE